MTDPLACPKHPDTCCNCPPTDEALRAAAELLERVAICDDFPQAARTIKQLIAHAKGERYQYAPEIAQEALLASTGPEHYQVAQAIVTLRIELPV